VTNLTDNEMRALADHMQGHLQNAYNCLTEILQADIEVTFVVCRRGEEEKRSCIVLCTADDAMPELQAAMTSVASASVAMLDKDGSITRGKH
jgi:hypothetical protein